jgi:hypothetical protein
MLGMTLNSIALAGLLLAAAGCMTVKKVQPAEYIPQHNPAVVWVTYTDNSFVPVAGPHIVGDSLEGTWQGLQEHVAIPLNQIQSVQARMSSPKRTILLLSSVGVVTAAVAYTLLTAGSSGSGNNCGFDKNGQQNQFC